MAKIWVFNAATNHWQSLGAGDDAGGDHGKLTGLTDDDHPQYYNQLRGDARYAQWNHDHDFPNDPQIYSDQVYLRPGNLRNGSNITIIDNKDGTVTISSTGGGTGTGGADEVSISTSEPLAPEAELWIDTDATAVFQTLAPPGTFDHGALNGLTDNDHPQYVLDSGDTMTGALTLVGAVGVKHGPTTGTAQITSESVDGGAFFDTRAPAGQSQGLVLRTAVSSRWLIGTDALAETGGNNGTGFAITRYDDNGNSLGAALTIARSNGEVSVAADPVTALGVSTMQYTDAKVENAVTGANPTKVAPSQDAIKKYVDNKVIVSDNAASGVYPPDTIWIEY